MSDGLSDGSGDAENVGDGDPVRLFESDGSLDGVTDFVGVGPSADSETVKLWETELVSVCDFVADISNVNDGVVEWDSLTSFDSVAEGVPESDDVDVGVGVGGGVIVVVLVLDGLLVNEVVSLTVPVTVDERVRDRSSEKESLGDPDNVMERVSERPSLESVLLKEIVAVMLELIEYDLVMLPSCVKLSFVTLELSVIDCVIDCERVNDAERELDVVRVLEEERDGLRDAPVPETS